MFDAFVFSLLFLALMIGYFLGRYRAYRKRIQNLEVSLPWPQKRYYEGLTYLLNDQPDAAIDTFVSALDVNSETLETHLALGNLLRKRGEVSRAIRVHQNLLSRPSLSREQLQLAQLELAVDYMRSGLLDRAEALFKELVDQRQVNKPLRQRALEFLIELYQDTHEWLLAIDIADRLTVKKFSGHADKWRKLQAQFCCELAEDAIDIRDWLSSRRWVRDALRYDKKCARASLIGAKIDIEDKDYSSAIATLKKVPQQDIRYSTEILADLYTCYKQLGKLNDFLSELVVNYEQSQNPVTLKLITKAKESQEGVEEALGFLINELMRVPRFQSIAEIFNGMLEEKPFKAELASKVRRALESLTDYNYSYQCEKCGFEGELLHWQCPSCKSWVSMTPSSGLT